MSEEKKHHLQPYLSPAGAWAYALGTSIGWGSLIITSTTYLRQAGPLGSALGMIVGALAMLIISRNYHYMINVCPEAGGVYAYTRNVFSYDHGFVVSWFLMLTYFAMLWANATALPLFAQYFLGNMFKVGRLYSVFGYDVYLGEALLSFAAVTAVGLVCTQSKRRMSWIMTGLVVFFTLAITFCFAAALFGKKQPIAPAFVPDKTALIQIIRIACISPWAFVGFENISHAAEGFAFPHRKTFRILVTAVVTTTLLYIFVTLLSASAYPPEYDSWLAYISDLEHLAGIKGLPAFYAAQTYLGNFGVTMLILALLALILTSLIGNILALSRLFYALGNDRVLPRRFAALNKREIPWRAILLIISFSAVVPFVGRTAIGWVVDVTTIGATIIYGTVSACTLKTARFQGDRKEQWTGAAGLVLMVALMAYLLLPNLFSDGMMETESYFLYVVWSVLGFIYFRTILRRDSEKRFGQSVVVWIVLLSLVLFVSMVWMSRSMMRETKHAMRAVQQFYNAAGAVEGGDAVIAKEIHEIRMASAGSISAVLLLFALSLGILMNNYSVMSRRARQSEKELGLVKDQANKDPLTGVKSKNAYVETEQEMNLKIENKLIAEFAVVVCDVNGLKHINDTLGHKAGDEYIRSACRMICEFYSHSPVYRFGGDEFVALLTGRDYASRNNILAQLNERCERHVQTGGPVVAAGMAEFFPGGDADLHAVFERADQRMYERKKELKAMGAVSR